MCRAIEDMCNQVVLEQVKVIAYRMLVAGKYSLEEIADVTELPIDEVKNLQAGQISSDIK